MSNVLLFHVNTELILSLDKLFFRCFNAIIVVYTGDSEDHDYRVWDINTRKILFKFNMHSDTILCTLECKNLSMMVSSSIDR
jgi:hypothetical protein